MKSRDEHEKKLRTIGRVSQITGCHIETIRYYERVGLLSKPSRTGGRFRLYDDEQIKRLGFIRRALNHLDNIKQKIADLIKLQAVLEDMVSQCEREEDRVPACPVIDALFQMTPPAPLEGTGLQRGSGGRGLPG